jgi:hypothetical protein
MKAVPWYPLTPPDTPGGIYELRSYTVKPGCLAQWSDVFQAGLPARSKFSKPVGIWFGEIGPLNSIVRLSWLDSISWVDMTTLTSQTRRTASMYYGCLLCSIISGIIIMGTIVLKYEPRLCRIHSGSTQVLQDVYRQASRTMLIVLFVLAQWLKVRRCWKPCTRRFWRQLRSRLYSRVRRWSSTLRACFLSFCFIVVLRASFVLLHELHGQVHQHARTKLSHGSSVHISYCELEICRPIRIPCIL